MSATPRLYVQADLADGSIVELGESQAHYLSKVMRLGEGAAVRLFNGRDDESEAIISDIAKRTMTLTVGGRTRPYQPCPDVWLAFAPIKKTQTDLIIEKATELGVRRILPTITARCGANSVRIDRFERIAMEAAEQTERLDLPEIATAQSLVQLLGGWDAERVLFYCDEAGEDEGAAWGGALGRAPPMSEVVERHSARPACVLIGPEGGFAAEERAILRNQSFVAPVSLGPRILRAETAVIAALSLWQAGSGDWREGLAITRLSDN